MNSKKPIAWMVDAEAFKLLSFHDQTKVFREFHTEEIEKYLNQKRCEQDEWLTHAPWDSLYGTPALKMKAIKALKSVHLTAREASTQFKVAEIKDLRFHVLRMAVKRGCYVKDHAHEYPWLYRLMLSHESKYMPFEMSLHGWCRHGVRVEAGGSQSGGYWLHLTEGMPWRDSLITKEDHEKGFWYAGKTPEEACEKAYQEMLAYAIQEELIKPFKFKKGDQVTFVNDYGVRFYGKTVIGCEMDLGKRKYHIEPTDTPWCAEYERNLVLAPSAEIAAQAYDL